jgi:hypothetical protein
MAEPAHYKVKILKNGEPIDGLTLERKHPASNRDKITLCGHALVRLKKDDKISVELEPVEKDIEYTVDVGGARLDIKLERRF